MTGADIAITLAVGVAVGSLSAALGVGGGLLMVPFMVLVLDLGQHTAEGTSLLVMVATAIAGVTVHARTGLVDFKAAGAIAIFGIAGAVLGASLALSLHGETLKALFGVLVIVVGADMVRRGWRTRPS